MPINIEFGRIYEEVRFGRDWREVLQSVMVERNPRGLRPAPVRVVHASCSATPAAT